MRLRVYFKRISPALSRIPIKLSAVKMNGLPAAVRLLSLRHVVDFVQTVAIRAIIYKQGLHQQMAPRPG